MTLRIAVLLFLACLSADVVAVDYFFDGSQKNNGNGSESSPFNALSSIKGIDLVPGDNILLKRGTRFFEALEVNSGGSPNHPLTIQPYGDEKLSLPLVQAAPHQLSSVLLENASHITLTGLEITNRGDNTTARRGVYVYAADAGAVDSIALRSLYIHDVQGYMPSTTGGKDISVGKYSNASGGIVIEASGNKTATFFKNILVEDNVIENVGRQGIYTWSNWCQRDALAQFWYTLCFQPWAPFEHLVVRNNRLTQIGGDGIVITGSVAAETYNNVVTTFNYNSAGNNAGIWTANSDGSWFHHNVVSGGTTNHDGMSYDVDHSTSGTIYEYNVSHDNDGGFMLLCPYDKPTQNFTIRYNLSVNDKARIFQICPGNLVGGKIYKNTIFIGDGLSPYMVLSPQHLDLQVFLADNIVTKTGSGTVTWQLDSSSFNVTNNVFHGITEYPNASGTITSASRLAAPGLRDPYAYQLLTGSPAYDSAVPIKGDAKRDFFANPVAQHNNIGFDSGALTSKLQWANSFDDGKLGKWTVCGGVDIVDDPAGDLGKSLVIRPGGKLSRRYSKDGSTLRLDARVMTGNASPTSHGADTISFGHVTVSLPDDTLGNIPLWHVLEIVVTEQGDATALWDGKPLPLSFNNNKLTERVTFRANKSTVYVDDVFILAS